MRQTAVIRTLRQIEPSTSQVIVKVYTLLYRQTVNYGASIERITRFGFGNTRQIDDILNGVSLLFHMNGDIISIKISYCLSLGFLLFSNSFLYDIVTSIVFNIIVQIKHTNDYHLS